MVDKEVSDMPSEQGQERILSFRTPGLIDIPGHSRTKKAWLYMTTDYEVINYPTIWAAEVAKRRSCSEETLNQYGSTLTRWLNFLETHGYGARRWQSVDRDVVDHFIDSLIQERNENGSPTDTTIEGYCARITDFYRSATKAGYEHYWDMDNEYFSKTIREKSTTTKNVTVDGLKREVKLHSGESTSLRKEIESFVRDEDLIKAFGLFDDYAYTAMSYVMRNTALRPKELLQLPFKGKGKNKGLLDYDVKEEEYIDKDGKPAVRKVLVAVDERDNRVVVRNDITFEFESKGKRREIPFPHHVWVFICEIWMPLRNKRAELYREKYGKSVGNNCLFLSESGRPVSYGMLWKSFNKVSELPEFSGKRFCPKMLRHAWASYYVYLALKKEGLLHSEYVYNLIHDDHLRKFIGHTDVITTYRNYVHVVHDFVQEGVMEKVIEEENKKLEAVMYNLAPRNVR
jgi:site-specific recombinase XerD